MSDLSTAAVHEDEGVAIDGDPEFKKLPLRERQERRTVDSEPKIGIDSNRMHSTEKPHSTRDRRIVRDHQERDAKITPTQDEAGRPTLRPGDHRPHRQFGGDSMGAAGDRRKPWIPVDLPIETPVMIVRCLVPPLFGSQGYSTKGVDGEDGMPSDGGLAAEHQGVRTVQDGIRRIRRLGPGR